MLSEWPVNTGTRTHVPLTRRLGDGEDLAALVAQLLLLVGLERAVVDVLAGVRQHVEGDRLDELARRRERDRGTVVRQLAGPVDDLAGLLVELVDAGEAAAADGLVRRRRSGGRDRPRRATA